MTLHWDINAHTAFHTVLVIITRYGDSVDNTVEHLLPTPNVLVAVSKGMQAVKLCINKILQFLTGGAG